MWPATYDLETKAIEADDVQSIEGQVRTHKQDLASGWMNNGYETHKLSHRTPHHIAHTIPDCDTTLAIEIGVSLFHQVDVSQQRADLDLLAIELRPAPLAAPFRRCNGKVGNGVGFDAGNQMIALFAQSLHDLSRRVVGIRHKIEGVNNCHDLEQVQHFVEQTAFIAI
jgi:ubiquinone biosynthesis protein Coq4